MMGGLHRTRLSPKQTLPIHTGFTIVETMIVLAVTGVMFVTIAANVSGRQHKVEFQQSVNRLKSQIEQTMGEVESGYFPSANFSCTVTGLGADAQFNFDSAGTTAQGARRPCVFMGKAIQFGNAFGTAPQKFAVYPLVGLNSLVDSTAVDFETSAPAPVTVSSLIDKQPLQNGLTVKRMWWGNNNTVWAVAFATSYSSSGSSSFGSQSIQIIPVHNSRDDEDGVDRMKSELAHSYPDRNPQGGVKLCLEDGFNEQSALMTIGAGGTSSSVTVNIKSKSDCQD
jgi:type II secretory pathway pseudopilin PulG